jgi:hypothetical protein
MQIPSPPTADAADAQVGEPVCLVGEDEYTQTTDLVGVYDESPIYGTNTKYRVMEGGQHRTCKEIVEHDKLQARTTVSDPSFPRWATRRPALIEFLDNLHTFQSL